MVEAKERRSGADSNRYDAARGNTRMRFEQWAKNPVCEANTISAVRNVRMAAVATADGLEPSFGQSPFAIIRGDQFERGLFLREGERLIEELKVEGVLPDDADGFADFRLRGNHGTRLRRLDEAIAETRLFLDAVAASGRGQRPPALAAAPTIRIPKGVMLPEAVLIIDALAVRFDADKPVLQVGEIKTYPDRGGHTDGGELAVARAQAGIYVHALELAVSDLGLVDQIEVSRRGFLVLTRPGSNQPRVRANEDLRYQAERARRGFELLERAAAALPDQVWALPDVDPPDPLVQAILDARVSYGESCLSFCDLAPRCFRRAAETGDPVILGEEVRRFLGTVSLPRALALMDGDTPINAAEQDFLARYRDSERMAVL